MSVGPGKIGIMPSDTLIHDAPVHRPAPVEVWLTTQAAAVYAGRHRGRVDDAPSGPGVGGRRRRETQALRQQQ